MLCYFYQKIFAKLNYYEYYYYLFILFFYKN